jgi:hypothetical protein
VRLEDIRKRQRTVLLVRENQVIPLPQKGATAGTSCALKVLCLGSIGALNSSLEILEGTVGNLAKDGGSGGL